MNGPATAPASAGARAFGRAAVGIGWVLVGVAIWLSQVQWPLPPGGIEPDPSWQQALSFALAHDIHFGSELVFTMGPLGGPTFGRYQPEIFWQQILLYEVLFKGLLAWRWTVALQQCPSKVGRAVFFAILVTLAVFDAFFLATLVVLAAPLLADERPHKSTLVLHLLLCAAIGYVKFTYLVLAAGLCLLVVVRASLRSRGEGALVLALSVLACFAVWIACGQRPLDLPVFLLRSAELARGYTESQARDGPLGDVITALSGIALLSATACVFVAASPRRGIAILTALAVLGGAFVAFRASYTNHGIRGLIFHAFLALAPCILVPASAVQRRARLQLAAGCAAVVLVALGGYTGWLGYTPGLSLAREGTQRIFFGLRSTLALPGLHERLEAERVLAAERFALPRTKAIVGSATIDFVGNAQNWLFHNGLNWKPRPVFQSYAACTEDLAALNAAWFESAHAPEFVLHQSDAIELRMPWMEDAPTRFALLTGYEPVAIERGLLLLRRDPSRSRRAHPRGDIVAEHDLRPGENFKIASLPGAALIARFDVRYSLLGKLRRAFYHAPETRIVLVGNDGLSRDRRFVPGMARGGILLRPALEFEDDWIDSFTTGATKRFQAFRLDSPNGWDTLFETTYHVTLERCDDLLPPLDPKLVLDLVFGSFPTRPIRIEGAHAPRYQYSESRDQVLVGPDARLIFRASAGTHRLLGDYGLFEPSLDRTDGVDFRFALVAPDGSSRTLLERTLDRSTPDATHAHLDLELTLRDGDELVITTSNPPSRNADWDMPWLAAIEIR